MFKKTGSSRVGAVLVGATALVLVGGVGGATGARLIDSGDIKNQSIQSVDIGTDAVGSSELRDGSVKPRDISDATRAALQGADGAPGADGSPGTDGTDGAPGADGVSGYEIVQGDVETVAAGAVGIAQAFCPLGKQVVGGGGGVGGNGLVLVATLPFVGSSTDPASWYVRYKNPTGSSDTFSAVAICATVD